MVSRVLAKTPNLAHDVLWPLSGQPRRDRIAQRPCSVTPGTVANGGALASLRGGGREEDRHNRYFQPDALHDPRFRASCPTDMSAYEMAALTADN
jgi:hypothetical protein